MEVSLDGNDSFGGVWVSQEACDHHSYDKVGAVWGAAILCAAERSNEVEVHVGGKDREDVSGNRSESFYGGASVTHRGDDVDLTVSGKVSHDRDSQGERSTSVEFSSKLEF